MLILVGASISLFLFILLLGKRGKTAADAVLAVWFLLMSFHLFLIRSYFSGFSYTHPALLGLDLPLPLVYGPLLFLYVRLLTGRLPAKKILLIPDFLLPAGFYIYQLHFFLLPGSEKVLYYRLQEVSSGFYVSLLYILILLSGFGYAAASAVVLGMHTRSIKKEFSNTEKISLSWLRYLISVFGGLWVCIFMTDYLPKAWLLKYRLSIETLTYGLVAVFIITIGYLGLRQTNIFVSVDKTEADGRGGGSRYSKSGLTEARALQILDRLNALMASEHYYTEPALTLSELAEKLGVNPNNLSQAINERAGTNFHDLINGYRVGEFKRRISEVASGDETILSLAFECGFNSKSTFNHIFKKQTGKTPRQYIIETRG